MRPEIGITDRTILRGDKYMEYRYIKATPRDAESVEFDIKMPIGDYVTTCVVGVQRLSCGIMKHPCVNGDDYKLSGAEMLQILKLVDEKRSAIKNSGSIKTLDGWRSCGLNLNDYLAVGDEVDEELVDEQMNVVPPRSLSAGYLQVGEAFANAWDGKGSYGPTYYTFYMKQENGRQFWVFAGYCFLEENENRIEAENPIKKLIQSMEDVGKGEKCDEADSE